MTDQKRLKYNKSQKRASEKALKIYKYLFFINAIIFTILNIFEAFKHIHIYSRPIPLLLSLFPIGIAWFGILFYKHQIKNGFIRSSDLFATFVMSVILAFFYI